MKVYNEIIKDEIGKPTSPSCFLGAWYHKVFSSYDKWLGIEATIKLPTVDIKRFDGKRNLDTPSIYMGGRSKYESDIGLSFTKGLILDENGKQVVSDGGTVFRPFWRYITDLETDEGVYDYENNRNYAVSNLGTNNGVSNCYGMYSPNYSEYYYLPGDIIRMVTEYVKKDHMRMRIEVIEESKYKESMELRKKYNWKSPQNFISPIFTSPENDEGLKEFKRVNAIDQSSNEGKPTIMTKTSVLNAIYSSVYLYREIDGEVFKVPLNNRRSDTMNCPVEEGFNLSEIDDLTGGSLVNIVPVNVYEEN